MLNINLYIYLNDKLRAIWLKIKNMTENLTLFLWMRIFEKTMIVDGGLGNKEIVHSGFRKKKNDNLWGFFIFHLLKIF